MASSTSSPAIFNPLDDELSVAIANNTPEKYIVEGGIGGPHFPVLDIPAIDFGLLTSTPPSPQGEKELERLRLALEFGGYFQVVNHGIEDSFLEEVHGVTRKFYSLPMDEKLRKCGRPIDDMEGYGADSVFSEKQILDWSHRLYLTINPESDRKFHLWPQDPPNFRKTLLEFTGKIEKINEVVLMAMAKSLKLSDEKCFLKMYGENPIVHSRFNFYPPCPWPNAVLAAKPHNDACAMTYLLQDKHVEGLQAMKDCQWYKVPRIPNAIIVNPGDQIEIMTNGIFKSPLHRVVANQHKDRMTLAIFCAPDVTSELGPMEELVDEKRPKLFKSVVNYYNGVFESLQARKRHIDLFRI